LCFGGAFVERDLSRDELIDIGCYQFRPNLPGLFVPRETREREKKQARSLNGLVNFKKLLPSSPTSIPVYSSTEREKWQTGSLRGLISLHRLLPSSPKFIQSGLSPERKTSGNSLMGQRIFHRLLLKSPKSFPAYLTHREEMNRSIGFLTRLAPTKRVTALICTGDRSKDRQPYRCILQRFLT
jgi:hypothetical protein